MLKTNTEELQKILAKVQALPEAGGETIEPVIEELNITENGTYTAPTGVDGYSPINVNVPIPEGYIKPNGSLDINTNGSYDVTEKASVNVDVKPILQNKTVTPTKEEQDIIADDVYDGLSKVTVNAIPDEYIIPSGTQEITENGTYDVTEKASVNINVASTDVTPTLQEKTVTPTTSSQSITPDSGYDGLSKVTVNPMPTTEQATPTVSIDNNGLITASSTQSEGYVTSGTKSATKQLTVQAAKTITPSTSSQTAVASGVYTTGAITVAAIPSSYVKPTTTKGATTYTPTTSNQTIASGTYLSGTQTIKGDTNLVAGNIKSGVSIFGVNGTYEGSGGGGGTTGTCNVTINVPGGVVMIGWGDGILVNVAGYEVNLPVSLPTTEAGTHYNSNKTSWNFPAIPIGSTFVFYRSSNIKGATVSDNIEFSFVNHNTIGVANYQFATCRCNGDGEITINI